jgi:tetratricopeptide (TPR) repeat protein
MIKESTCQAGVIYKNDLQEYIKSSALFMNLLSRFPYDKNYAALSYYNVYINHLEVGKDQEAEAMKNLLLHNFPKSVYAQLLTNPNFQDQLINLQNEDELAYQGVYQLYVAKQYMQVIEKCKLVSDDDYQSKYLFLKALSFSALKDSAECINILDKIISIDKDPRIIKEAIYLLEAIKNPEKVKKANEQALTNSPYLFRSGNTHMSLFILPKEGMDINYLKILISDYHSNNFENDVFEISAMLMGKDVHLLMIKIFDNSSDVVDYNQLIMENIDIVNQLNKSDYKVLAISFENFKYFYKNKDVEGYYNFFKKNYLDNN